MSIAGRYFDSLELIEDQFDRICNRDDVPLSVRQKGRDLWKSYCLERSNLMKIDDTSYARRMIERYDKRLMDLYSEF